jgi:formyltetrahydrofolate deformylase
VDVQGGSHEQRQGSSEQPAADGAEVPRYDGRLLIGCPDRPGIVAAVSGFLFERGANIVSSHQYSSDPSGGRFFLRTEFFLPDASAIEELQRDFAAAVGETFEMDFEVRRWGERRRLAILVSRYDHCMLDLLWRWRRGELEAEIVAVVSNHPDLEHEALAAGVPFHLVPVQRGSKDVAEARMIELLAGNAELLVLARYMQILSGEFLHGVAMPAINIHHSFLPAFAGADPYRRARERGVKLIGATAHYVTEELDDGPIIEQDVVRVDHRQSARELERIGRDVERMVLARAVALHLDDRVIVDGRRTVVF